MPEQIIKAPTAESFKVQIVNMVMDRKQHSEQHYTGIRKEFPQLYDLYRGVLTGRFSPHKNNIHIPLIFSTIQSDVARKTQTSFGTWPIVSFAGYGPDDAPIARKREALISAQMKDSGAFKKGYEVFLTADLYGTAVVQYGWNHTEQEMEFTLPDTLPLSGETVQRLVKQRVTVYDGPDWKVLDALDCFPQPGFRNIEDMGWFIVREYLDLDDIRVLAKKDVNGWTLFDADEVARMEKDGQVRYPATDDYKNWRAMGRTMYESEARLREKYARPIELLTCWGVVPSELATDGVVNRVITVANGRYLLRNRPNPYLSGKKPLRAYSPMPDPHFFWASGKAEVAKKLQIIANRFTNQQLDALDIYIDPVFFVNSSMGLTRDLMMKPGRFFQVEGIPQENIMPLIPNLTGVQVGGQMTEMVWRWMQQGSGIVEDTVMGGQSKGGTTAREYLGRAEAVATRLQMESRIFEEQFLEPMVDDWVDLNRQFLQMPKEVTILGQGAYQDPVNQGPAPEVNRDSISGYDLVPNYDARAMGATTRLNRAQRQQNLTFLLQAASANPMVAAAVNWNNFFRDLFREFEMTNVNELLNSPQQQMQMMQAMQGGAPAPGEQQSTVPGTPAQFGTYGIPNYAGQGVT